MNCLAKHVVLPAFAPAAIVALYFTSVSALGCVYRGLLALAVALLSTLAACLTAAFGARARRHAPERMVWWMISTLILLLPVVLLFGPLG